MVISFKKAFIFFVLLLFIVVFVLFIANQGQSKEMVFLAEDTLLVVDTEVVQLNDGDFFDLSAEMVMKEIEGQLVTMMAYNGSIPGPIIKVQQGATVTINFTNNTLIENTIHSHGVRLDNEFDGVPEVTQEAVQPGESFEYEIIFLDPGVYWYHPHVREDLTQEMGLYGAFVVEPEDVNYWNEVNREEYVFLDDYLSGDEGLFSFYEDDITHVLMGRYGDKFLINGEDKYYLEVMQNEMVRFAFLNVANVRPFNIAIEGITTKLVGSDGGVYEKEEFIESAIIAPSERYLVEAYFSEPGVYALQHITPDETYELGFITVLEEEIEIDYGNAFETFRENTLVRDEVVDFETYYEKEADKILRLTLEMDMGTMAMMEESMEMEEDMTGIPCHEMAGGMMMGDCDEDDEGHENGIEWEDEMVIMNQVSTNENIEWQIVDKETGDVNDEIDWILK